MKENNISSNCVEVARLLESPLLITTVFLRADFKCCWESLAGLHNTQMPQPHYARLPGQVTCAVVLLVTFSSIGANELARKRVEMIVNHFYTFALPSSRTFFMLLFS